MIFNKVLYGEITILRLLMAVGIGIGSIVISKIIAVYLRRSIREKIGKEPVELIIKIVYYVIISIALLSILAILGVNLSGLMVAGGIIGIIIGFASQSIVGNLISGFFLMVERPIRIGNQVNIEGTKGFVEDIRIISTTIRTYDGLYVRIPNEKVFTTNITNYVSHQIRRIEYKVGIRYSDDADEAIKIIKDVIDQHPYSLIQPSPHAYVGELGDNAMVIIVRFWTPITEWYNTKNQLLWILKKTLEENDIEIAFPQRTLWFANELQQKRKNE